MKLFTVEQLRIYLENEVSLTSALNNLSEENIKKSQELYHEEMFKPLEEINFNLVADEQPT